MPWSPVRYFPEIVRNLRRKGFTKEVSTDILAAEIMRVTGLIRPQTLKRVVYAMETLGYIKMVSESGIWKLKEVQE